MYLHTTMTSWRTLNEHFIDEPPTCAKFTLFTWHPKRIRACTRHYRQQTTGWLLLKYNNSVILQFGRGRCRFEHATSPGPRFHFGRRFGVFEVFRRVSWPSAEWHSRRQIIGLYFKKLPEHVEYNTSPLTLLSRVGRIIDEQYESRVVVRYRVFFFNLRIKL